MTQRTRIVQLNWVPISRFVKNFDAVKLGDCAEDDDGGLIIALPMANGNASDEWELGKVHRDNWNADTQSSVASVLKTGQGTWHGYIQDGWVQE